MFLCLFNIFILIYSQLVVYTSTFEINGCFFKLCGSAMQYIKRMRDYFKCSLLNVNCKLIEKKDGLKESIKKLFGSSMGKVYKNVEPLKSYFLYDEIANMTDTARRFMTRKNTGGEKSGNLNKTITKTLKKSSNMASENLNGFNAEVHTVITQDGYLLTLHRIPAKINWNKHKGYIPKNRTVILHHGLLGSSTDWTLLGPNNSLPHLLNDAGYDVWLANARGNKYSKAHVTKSIHSSEYWDFSWHEIGLYDLSSTIDYINEKTFSKSQMFFIAHSMGATALMVLLSSCPQYRKIFDLVILLAPLVYMQQAKGPLRLMSEMQYSNYSATVKILGGDYFNPAEPFINVLMRKFCRGETRLCRHPLFMITDGGKPIKNPIHKVKIYTQVQAQGSVKTLMHYGQLISSGKFEMFDEGSSINIKKFGLVSPPKYHLKEIKLPVVLFSSHDDWLSTVPDIHSLLSILPNPVAHHVVQMTGEEFSHFDFVWNENAPKLVYKYIFDFFEQS